MSMGMMVTSSSGQVEQWDKVSPDSHAKCQVIVVEGALDVGHHIVLVHRHREHLNEQEKC